MKISLLFNLLFLLLSSQVRSQSHLKLVNGTSFSVEKVFCINQDTLFLKLSNVDQYNKVAIKEIASFNFENFPNVQKRRFKYNYMTRYYKKRLANKKLGYIYSGGVLAGISSTAGTALGIGALTYMYGNMTSAQMLVLSGAAGLAVGTVVAIHTINRSIDFIAFLYAVELD